MKKTTEQEVFEANVREVMSTTAGREVIWAILSECGLYGDPFTGDDRTFCIIGQQNIGRYILAMLEDADPSLYPNLLLTFLKKEASNGNGNSGNDYSNNAGILSNISGPEGDGSEYFGDFRGKGDTERDED